jgi:hypothetical protein
MCKEAWLAPDRCPPTFDEADADAPPRHPRTKGKTDEAANHSPCDRSRHGGRARHRTDGSRPQPRPRLAAHRGSVQVGSIKSVTLPDGSLLDLRPETTPQDEIGTAFAADEGNSAVEKGACPS